MHEGSGLRFAPRGYVGRRHTPITANRPKGQPVLRGLVGLLIIVAIVLFLVKVALVGGIVGLIALVLLVLLIAGRL